MPRKILSVALLLLASATGAADEVREYTDNGVRYRETRSIVRRPLVEQAVEERQHTIYTERVNTELRPSYRTLLTPVTEYHWEPYLANRWNPFGQPYWSYRFVPRTRWDSRVEEHQVPITTRELVPEQRTVQVPVVRQRMVDEEVIRRVAVSPAGSDPFAAGTTSVVRRDAIGGAKLEGDPPRTGSTWQPVDGTSLKR